MPETAAHLIGAGQGYAAVVAFGIVYCLGINKPGFNQKPPN